MWIAEISQCHFVCIWNDAQPAGLGTIRVGMRKASHIGRAMEEVLLGGTVV